MTRSTLVTANREQTSGATVRPVGFLRLAFPSGTMYLNDSDRSITWGGNTFVASTPIVEVGDVAELVTLKANRVSLKLAATSELLTKVFTDRYQFAEAAVWEGYCDEDWQLVADPYLLVDGLLMSVAVVTLDRGVQALELQCEGWEVFGLRDAAALATAQAQRQRYPGDTGLDRVISITTEEIEWGGVFQRS